MTRYLPSCSPAEPAVVTTCSQVLHFVIRRRCQLPTSTRAGSRNAFPPSRRVSTRSASKPRSVSNSPQKPDVARRGRIGRLRRQTRSHHCDGRATAGEDLAPPADQRAPRQRQIGNPPDVPRGHAGGLRTAKFSGRNLSVRKPPHLGRDTQCHVSLVWGGPVDKGQYGGR
jgi:hypothetical protein